MIPATMKAVVAHSRDRYTVETVPVPTPVGAEILLKVEACGVCAGDLKCAEGGFRFWGGEGNPPYAEPPFIPGHEFLGHVVALGPTYEGPYRIGDRVISEQIVPCGHCRYCREGKYWLCDPHVVYGFKEERPGGFAEYVILPEQARIYRVPADMPIMKAVLIEPYACARHAVERARITSDDIVVIAGAGTLGLAMVAQAALLHPKALISVEPVVRLREIALRLGATHAIDAWKGEGVPDFLREMSDGVGCDVYIEASGHTAAISQGLQMIKKGGRFVEFSVFSGPANIDWSLIGDNKELDLYGVSLSPDCFPKVIDGFQDGSIGTDGVLTHMLPLADFAKAFYLMKKREAIKVALIPGT